MEEYYTVNQFEEYLDMLDLEELEFLFSDSICPPNQYYVKAYKYITRDDLIKTLLEDYSIKRLEANYG